MIYLSYFEFPTEDVENDFLLREKRTCYDSFYPFSVLSKRRLYRLELEPITVLYGGNGSGKTTVLNVIAEKLKLRRDTLYNRSSFFDKYTQLCRYGTKEDIPRDSRVITSDDVFDFMLNLRNINEGIDIRRDELFEEYLDAKYSDFHMESIRDYERLKKVNMSRSKSQSRFVRKNLMGNIQEHSNGESAFMYFSEAIDEHKLYLLDEPENSLSPERQLELMKFIEESARFFGCQFLIATHSPFLLSMKGAKIYDMDGDEVCVKRWTELKSVRTYYDFFMQYAGEFED